jgi:restriction system protein
MAVWLARAGRHGEHETLAIETGIVLIGWQGMPDMSKVQTREEVEETYQKAYPDAGSGRRANHVGQFWAFVHRIQVDDLVVLPRKRGSTIAVGKLKGAYKYCPDIGDSPHTRPVEWLRKDIPRTSVEQVLLYTLGSAMTVCQVERNNAEARIRALIEGKADPFASTVGIDAELVHLVHADHTAAFWKRLGKIMPDYEIRRRGLREMGRGMEW